MYPHLYNRFQSLRKYCPFDGINCRKGWKHNTKLSCIESDFLFASFPKLGIRYDRPCILEMKYLFASDCYLKEKKKNMAGQRDLKERVRLIVYSSTFFFDCKNVRVSVFHSLEVRLIELQLSYSSNTMSNLAT